ncbi:hypothetical protein [Nitrosopumilus ureiphilus]|nr:hypothetical protein [Nitrosopumilus ureiphilus]
MRTAVPDQGMREPQPQMSAKVTLRLDEAGRGHPTCWVVVHRLK